MTYIIEPAQFTTLLLQPASAFGAANGLVVQTVTGGGAASVGGSILGVAGATGSITWGATSSVSGASTIVASAGVLGNDQASYQIGPVNIGSSAPLVSTEFGAAGVSVQAPFPASTNTPPAVQQATHAVSFTFSAPLPAGTPFVIQDPLGLENGALLPNQTLSFAIAAALGAASVSTASWTVTEARPASLLGPLPSTTLGSGGMIMYTDQATGQGGVKAGSLNSRPNFLITTTAPIDSFSLNATAYSFDAIGVSVIIPAAQNTTVTDTVAGAGGSSFAIPFTTPRDASLAAPLLDSFSSSVTRGSATVYGASASLPAAPAGLAAIAATSAFAGAMSTYTAFFTDAAGATTLTGGSAANQTIVAGTGGLLFTAQSVGGGQIVTGGGNSSFVAPTIGSSAWNVDFGSGSNTVVSGSGTDTIDAGNGANLMFLGSGSTAVTSEGTDTIVAGTGSASVSALGNALIFNGAGALDFTATGGSSTVAALAGGTDTLHGGSGTMLGFAFAPVSYIGASGADTIVAIDGALSAHAGPGGGLFFGTSSGGNVIAGGSGSTTIVGGGAGDVLSTNGTGNNVVAAAGGSETIDASRSSGANSIFLGPGSDSVSGGTGANAYLLGTGSATINGAGANLYVLANASSATRSLLIDNFQVNTDHVLLMGYASGAAAAAVQGETKGAIGITITLADGSQVTFAGLAAIATSSFL